MSTPSQINANRTNAQSSTGPRTESGKAKMRLNPTKHGLAAQVLIVPGEDPAAFEDLYLDLLAEHEPVTVTEELLVYKIAEQFWFSRRASILMVQAGAQEFDAKRLALMLRYQGAADRMFLKCLNELRKLQKERKLNEIGSASQTPETPQPQPHTPMSENPDLRHPAPNLRPLRPRSPLWSTKNKPPDRKFLSKITASPQPKPEVHSSAAATAKHRDHPQPNCVT